MLQATTLLLWSISFELFVDRKRFISFFEIGRFNGFRLRVVYASCG